uniref:Uncharacterized protein n=1 Tax=Anguilla anguilla TaxID=7936 RepID=A0A0E9XMQ5_ANGAN
MFHFQTDNIMLL